MNNIIVFIFIIFFVIITSLLLFSNCNTKIYDKPIWPCPYNENRLKYLYIKEASGKYTSQSLFDIYSFTHISHGILLFYILYYLNNYKKYKYMIFIALIYETLWEIVENSPYVINKYRKNSTLSRDYHGDSIINSIGDILSMSIGFYIAWFFPKYGFIIFLINEIVLYKLINDNLLTNMYQIILK